MQERILPPHEWFRLSGTLLETVWPTLDRATSRILVLEDRGQIVACTLFCQMWHLEGTWIAPEHRGRVSLGRRFLRSIRATARRLRVSELWMMATTPESSRLCQKLGPTTALTCEHFAVQMEKT